MNKDKLLKILKNFSTRLIYKVVLNHLNFYNSLLISLSAKKVVDNLKKLTSTFNR